MLLRRGASVERGETERATVTKNGESDPEERARPAASASHVRGDVPHRTVAEAAVVDPSALSPDRLSAIILAGGRSRRMGRPKAWLPLGGVPLLTAVVARVRPLVADVIVVAARDQELPACDARV